MKFWSQMPIKENPSMEDVLMLGDTLDVNNPKTITLQQIMDIAGEKVSSVEVVEELPAEGRENKLYIKKISQDDTYVYESYIWDNDSYHQTSGGGTDEKTIRQIEHRGIDIMNYARGSGNSGFVGDVFGRIEKINNINCIVYELHGYDDKQDVIKLNMDEITDMHHDPSKVNEPTIEEGILKGLRPINITATCRYVYDTTYSKPQVEIPVTDEMWNYPVAFKGTFVNTHSYGDDYVGTPTTSIGMVYKNREGTTGTYSNPLTLRECYGHTIRLLVCFKFNILNGRYLIKTPYYLLQGYISPEPEIRKLIGSLPERIQVLDHGGTSNDNSIVVFDYEENPVIKIDSEMDRAGDNVTINYPCDDEINGYNQKAMQIKSDGTTIRKPGDQDSIALSVGVDKCHFGLNNQTCFESNEAKTIVSENNDPSKFSVYGGHTYIVKSAIDKHFDYIIYNGQNYYENQRFYVASDGYAYKSEHAQRDWDQIRLYQLKGYNEVKIKDVNNQSEIGIKDGDILIEAHNSTVLKTDHNQNQLTLRNPFTYGDIIKTCEGSNQSITFYSGVDGVDGQLLRWEHSYDNNKIMVKLYGGDQNSIIESCCDLGNNSNKIIRINKHHENVEKGGRCNEIIIRDTPGDVEYSQKNDEGIHFVANKLTFTDPSDKYSNTKKILAAGEETIDMGENDKISITPKNEYRYTINNLNYGNNQALTIDGLNNGDFTIEFSIGNDIPTITFSNDIKFMSPPDFNSNQHWIIAVHNNYAVYAKYDL